MDENKFLTILSEQIWSFVRLLEKLISNPTYRKYFFKEYGWEIDHLPNKELLEAINAIVSEIKELNSLIENRTDSFEDVMGFISSFESVILNLKSLKETFQDSSNIPLEIIEGISKSILDGLFINYLQKETPLMFSLINLFRFIKENKNNDFYIIENKILRFPVTTLELNIKDFSLFFKDTKQYLNNLFGNIFDFEKQSDVEKFTNKFYPLLSQLIIYLGGYPNYGLNEELGVNHDENSRKISLTHFSTFWQITDEFSFGFLLNYSSKEFGNLGWVIIPFGNLNLKIELDEWNFNIESKGGIGGLNIKKSGVSFFESETHLNLELHLTKLAKINGRSFLIGSLEGSHFSIGKNSYTAGVLINSSTQDYYLYSVLKDIEIVISGNDGDGFINKILGEEGIQGKFDLEIGFSSVAGFHIKGSGGLEIILPAHLEIGPISIENLIIGIYLKDSGLKVSAGASIGAKLGPVALVVENLGLQSDIMIKEKGGNIGPLDFNLGFKPPNGIGISIDASVVKGGGYLYIDTDKGLYYGAAELTINELVSVKAVAIINTKLSDGSEGYSFLVLISAEFSPIQLGLGFTLSGVGGLVGIHRGMHLDSIAGAVMDDTLKNMLFPEDPVGNITGIMSSLNSFFPIEQDSFTFGILLSLGWGTPQLVDIELGLIVSIPDTIVIVGILKLLLPDPKSAVVKLQVNFSGGIDFKQKYAYFNAKLFDSEILIFQIEGSLFFYLDWGDPPYFVFSIGGFHPTFTLPKLKIGVSQANLKRLQLRLMDSDNPKLLLEFYFAVTSNTVQFGAALDFKLDVEVAQVVGFLHFDALFQFNPFYFIVSLSAGFQVLVGGTPIMGVTYSGTLEGPTPWHLTGYAQFTMFIFINIRINIDETFGEEKELIAPGVSALLMLEEAILQDQSWQLLPPKNAMDSVVLREIEIALDETTTDDQDSSSQPTTLVAHPNARIILSQSKIPLGIILDKIGEQRIIDYNRFSLSADVDGDKKDDVTSESKGTIREYFARAQFKNLTEKDKLELPSFEPMDSGIEMTAGDSCFFDESSIVCSEVAYEMQVIDTHGFAEILKLKYGMPLHLSGSYVQQNAIARSSIGEHTVQQRQDLVVKDRFKFKKPNVQVLHTDTLGTLLNNEILDSKGQAQEVLRNASSKKYEVLYDYELQEL